MPCITQVNPRIKRHDPVQPYSSKGSGRPHTTSAPPTEAAGALDTTSYRVPLVAILFGKLARSYPSRLFDPCSSPGRLILSMVNQPSATQIIYIEAARCGRPWPTSPTRQRQSRGLT